MNATLALLVLTCGVVACDGANPQTSSATTSAQASARSSASSAAATSSSLALTSASAATSSAALASAAPTAPTVAPLEPSPRPTKEEWEAAPAVEVKPPVVGCTLKTLREWSRVSCERNYFGVMGTFGLGKVGERHFLTSGGESGAVEIQAKRGELSAVKMLREPPAIVRVGWPSDEPRPTLIVLEDKNGSFDPLPNDEPDATAPAIPSEPSPRPTSGDWLKARRVSTIGAKRAPGCEIAILRDWLRARCKGVSIGFSGVTGFGKLGEDYFTLTTLDGGELVARLKPGMSARADHMNMPANEILSVKWPSGQDRPETVAFYREGTKL